MTDGSLAVTLLRAGVSLVIVLGLLILVLRVLANRTGAVRRRPHAPAVDVDVLARRQLTRGASVHVVQVAGKLLVLGVTDTTVRVLTRLAPADVEKEDDDTDAADSASTTGRGLQDAARTQGEIGRYIAALTARQRGRHRG